jgi:hypothetical protein
LEEKALSEGVRATTHFVEGRIFPLPSFVEGRA